MASGKLQIANLGKNAPHFIELKRIPEEFNHNFQFAIFNLPLKKEGDC